MIDFCDCIRPTVMSNYFRNGIILLVVAITHSIEASFISPFSPKCSERKHISYYGPHSVAQQQRIPVNMSNDGDILVSNWQPATYVVLSAVVLGVLIQGFINTMLKGDQGLSAFLSDGSGFNKSNFKPTENDRKDNDPLPWLKLPKFDFVEVAGQLNEEEELELSVVKKLESLSAQMKEEIDAGETDKAASTMQQLNELMDQYGFEYKQD